MIDKKLALEFEEALSDLVAEFQGRGLDLMSIFSILELQSYAVSEAMNDEAGFYDDNHIGQGRSP
jgi:hypothetical protein